MMTIRNALLVLLASPLAALCQIEALGTVVDAGSELPVPKVRMFSADSTFLGSSNDQGRWELRVNRPIEVTFRKEGYREQILALADLTDLLDVVVDLEPMGKTLEARSVKGKGGSKTVQVGAIATIEQMSGMRMDLQEHLRNLPGVSGVREFSSEISIYGSRTHDVSHVLGPFQIPNLRHLDFSFPGNQSVLSPRVLQGISVEHDPTKGPLEQGLASALVYQPLRPPTDRYDATLSWGLTNRELNITGPVNNGTFVASGRWLAPSSLNHLADRFFVGPRDQDPASPKDTSTIATSRIDLTAFDGYARLEQGIGPFAVSFTALGASDDHSVSLYTHRSDGSQGYQSIQQGSKLDLVTFADAQGELASGWLQMYAGGVFGSQGLQMSDTLLRDSGEATASDWSATTLDRSDWRAGAAFRPNGQILGMDPEILAAVDLIEEKREFGKGFFYGGASGKIVENRPQFGGFPISTDFSYLRSRSAFRLRGKADKTEWGLAAGGLWTQDAGFGTEATASLMGPWAGFGWLANASMRSSEATEAVSLGQLGVRQILSKELKVGVGRTIGPIELTVTTYWRGIENPELPKADFLWILPNFRHAKDASVLGGTLQAKWTSWHPLQIQTNLSRVQGDYNMADGSTMEWEANRGFDAWTLFKIHPRTDTMVSIILSHSASLGKPYYNYRIDTLGRTISVQADPAAPDGAKVRNQFRTDIRTELQIPTNLAPFRQLRFYAEVQNIFGQFDGDWARVLGGSNYRARSWTPVSHTDLRKEGEQYVVKQSALEGADPLYASGTDLFISFGIEARLGF